jgi:hypothetical protein
MADDFRTFRREPPARGAAPLRDSVDDPLAELARLIGQSAPRPSQGGGTADARRYEDALPQVDWAAGDDAYAEPAQATHDGYASHSPHDAAWPDEADDRERGYDDATPARHYADTNAALNEDLDHGERRSPAFGTNPPRYASPGHDDYPGDHDPPYAAQGPYAEDAAYDPADEEHERESHVSGRSATILILAVLGLAVLGTAGAFGYRAMFGGSMVAGLPPIIKPPAGPIKVQPSQEAQAGKPGQAETANKGTGERLVEHQEQPVDVQSANPPVPRVVQTIPVISNAPGAPIPGGQPAELNPPAPMPALPGQQAIALPPAAANPPAAPAPQQAQPLGPAASGAKQVHTVIIRPGQQQAAANPPPAAPPPAATHAIRLHEPAQRQPRRTATAGGPLSIVPGPEGEARPARSRVAMRAPERTEAASSVGGYAVQVTSQRSEAEAEAAFRALQARYPQELGGRRPLVRRADLGAKGTYYRALVGPFASGEQATELCSKLKAAGGSCIVQKN